MMPSEKARLLDLLDSGSRWCQDVEAQDASGAAVHFDDPTAVAWDLTGALCQLFGWPRACVLFPQLDRHIHGKRAGMSWPVRDTVLEAMAALQDFNDRAETSFALLRQTLESMPVWRGRGEELETAPQGA